MPKRKRVVLSMNDKYEINKRLEEGESATKLSNEYNVGKSTITNIKKQKTNITNFINQLDSTDGSTSRKTMKLAANTDLDDAVYKWFTQKRSQGEHISGPILCEKAIQFNINLGGASNFQESTGWFKRFKARHGMLKELDSHECDEEDIQEWMSVDNADPGYQVMQDSEIVNLVSDQSDAASISSASDSEKEEEKKTSCF